MAVMGDSVSGKNTRSCSLPESGMYPRLDFSPSKRCLRVVLESGGDHVFRHFWGASDYGTLGRISPSLAVSFS